MTDQQHDRIQRLVALNLGMRSWDGRETAMLAKIGRETHLTTRESEALERMWSDYQHRLTEPTNGATS